MHCAGLGILIGGKEAISYMFTVKFTFSEPFAILPVTSSHLHILYLFILTIKVGGYSNHLYLYKIRDVHNSLVGVAIVGVAVVTHRSSLFSMMEKITLSCRFSKLLQCR